MTFGTSRERKMSINSIFFCLFTLFLLALFLKNPHVASNAVIEALKKCGHLLIPSLFPLMVASEIAVESGSVEYFTRPLSGVVAKILGIKKDSTAPLFLGLIGGYTTSVGGALSLYKSGKIDKTDCERIIALSSLPSLSFLTGFVGLGVLGSVADGWILWAIAVTSALIVGFLTRKSVPKLTRVEFFRTENTNRPPISKIIVGAISHSAYSMLLICSCVIFFYALIAALRFPLDAVGIPEGAQGIVLGSLEITNGVLECANITSRSLRAAACGAIVGWSGLSVHFQIISLCDGLGLSFKKYFIFKALQGILTAAISYLVFRF